MKLELAGAGDAHQEALRRLARERAVERIWAGDASLWKDDPSNRKTIESALGWLTIADRMEKGAPELQEFAASCARDADRVVVLGMGGSSLAPLVFSDSFPRRSGFPVLEVLDSTSPAAVLETARGAPPDRTLFVVSSKSGSTLEPNIFFDYFYEAAREALGDAAGNRFLVITDPGSALEKEAGRRRVRRIFPGDPTIGGRYSALSNFGIVPAALAGIDVAELLRRARVMAQSCRNAGDENPGLVLGAAMGVLALSGRDKLTFDVGAPIPRFGMWIEQLVAESTGKEGKGILPVEGETPGPPDVYGNDRFFVSIATADREMEHDARLGPLVAAGHPVARFQVEDALDLGAEMFRWEFATAVAGKLLAINPFDQPNVQEAKDGTNGILAGDAGTEGNEPLPADQRDSAALDELLASVHAGDYFSIMAYVPATAENEAALNRLRLRVREAKRVATTAGFGPRFLHSTGQLHKGGPDTGVFLQLTAESAEDVAIPGRAWGFARVIQAQAAGDLGALKKRGRRAIEFSLGEDVARGLTRLGERLNEILNRNETS
ncbi:MAG: glucose-6-phosphate isomerase [Acidobacteriota bacterium]